MNRQEVRELFKMFSPIEEKLKKGEMPTELISYNKQMEKESGSREKGYYYLTKRTKPEFNPADESINSKLSRSRLQNNLRLTKHLRFTHDPFHHDGFISIIYAYSGNMKIHFLDKTVTLEKGHLCLMGANVIRSYEIGAEEDIILSFQMEREYLHKELLYGLANRVSVFDFLMSSVFNLKNEFIYSIYDCSADEHLAEIFEDVFIEYLEPSLCSEAMVEAYLKLIFISIIRSAKSQSEAEVDVTVKILEYIENNSSTCTLSQLSEEFNFNPKYLSFMIKKKTGESFSDTLLNTRMKEICIYLLNSSLPVKEIAEQCGYSNMNFFYKKFRERYHMSPKEYREREKYIE